MKPGSWKFESKSPLVHSWDGPDDIPRLSEAHAPARALAVAGSAMPPEEIRRRSIDWKSRHAASPGWQILETPNTEVRGDVPLEGLMAAGAYAEELNVLLNSAIGGGKRRDRFLFKIFESQTDFRQFATYAGAASAESFYAPLSKEAAFWFGLYTSPELFQRGFAHEFTHAFMDLNWNRTDPLWFAEGMAEYFSNLEWKSDRLVGGQINPRDIELLKMESLTPLEELFRLGRGDMYGPRFPHLYAKAWSVVHFMFSKTPEVIKAILERGQVGVPNPAAIEPEWLTYVEDLMR